MDGQDELEQTEHVANERNDRVQYVQDDHSGADVIREAEAIEDEHLVVVDVVQQVVLEVVSLLTRHSLSHADVQFGLG